MPSLDNLYQELILDHNKNPKNFGKLSRPTHQAKGHNPLCGDMVELMTKVSRGKIVDIKFSGQGCAISTASASIMTHLLKGKSVVEVVPLFSLFQRLTAGRLTEKQLKNMGLLQAFGGLKDYPLRVKCATLPWHTLLAALEKKKEVVQTEQKGKKLSDAAIKSLIVEKLKTVMDPEIALNIYDLGLIYGVAVKKGKVEVTMTLTTPNCPVADTFPNQVRDAVKTVPGVKTAEVELTWDPPWTKERLSEGARLELGLL